MALDPHVTSALNRLLTSPLRVEIDEVAMDSGGLANLSALAREIQRSVDGLDDAPLERLSQQHVWKDGGLRVVWHARARRKGEEADPVIVS